jgi:hypothetical protein
MRNALVWLVVLVSLSGSSSACAFGKKRPPQPEREVCFIGDAGCICFDPRFDEIPAGTYPIACDRGNGVCYVRPLELCENYQAYSPQDYNALQGWIKEQCHGPRD